MIQQRTSLFLSSCGFLGILAGVFFVLLPLNRQVQTSARRLDTARQQQVQLLETTRATSLQKRTIKSLKEEGIDFSSFRVSESTIVDFLDSFETAGTDNGITLVVENLPPPSATKQSTIPFSLQGTLPGILGFLEDLEALPTYLSITRLSLTPLDTGTPHPMLTATLSATLPWQ